MAKDKKTTKPKKGLSFTEQKLADIRQADMVVARREKDVEAAKEALKAEKEEYDLADKELHELIRASNTPLLDQGSGKG